MRHVTEPIRRPSPGDALLGDGRSEPFAPAATNPRILSTEPPRQVPRSPETMRSNLDRLKRKSTMPKKRVKEAERHGHGSSRTTVRPAPGIQRADKRADDRTHLQARADAGSHRRGSRRDIQCEGMAELAPGSTPIGDTGWPPHLVPILLVVWPACSPTSACCMLPGIDAAESDWSIDRLNLRCATVGAAWARHRRSSITVSFELSRR